MAGALLNSEGKMGHLFEPEMIRFAFISIAIVCGLMLGIEACSRS